MPPVELQRTHTTVDYEFASDGEGALIGGEKNHRLDDLVRCRAAAKWNLLH